MFSGYPHETMELSLVPGAVCEPENTGSEMPWPARNWSGEPSATSHSLASSASPLKTLEASLGLTTTSRFEIVSWPSSTSKLTFEKFLPA